MPDAAELHPRTRGLRRRLAAACILVVVVALGLATHFALPESDLSDVAGDALYAVALYLGVVVLAPRLRPWWPALISAVWCTAVELFQLTGVPAMLAEAGSPLALVLGAGFDVRDLIVYLCAIAAATAVDLAARAAPAPAR